MYRTNEDNEGEPANVRRGMCQDPQAQDGACVGEIARTAREKQREVSRVVCEKQGAPHRERDGEEGAVGRFFITPHAVHKYQREVKPNSSYNEALSDLIKITNAGRQCGTYKGGRIQDMVGEGVKIEMWRGPVVGTRAKQRRNSRMRFVVAHGPVGALPQVVTVLPRGKK